jgi:hypothetical protein
MLRLFLLGLWAPECLQMLFPEILFDPWVLEQLLLNQEAPSQALKR